MNPQTRSKTTAAQLVAIDSTQLLTDLLEIPSVSGTEQEAVAALVVAMGKYGFDAEADAAGNFVARWGDGPVHVMLLGHIDTVPGEIAVRREGELLYGRGAVDAKGPLVAALTAVARQPQHGRYRFTVVGAVDEEADSKGATAFIDQPSPDHLIILEPSGWDGITVGYKGTVRTRLVAKRPMQHGASGDSGAADNVVAVINALRAWADERNAGLRVFEQVDVRVRRINSGDDGLREVCTASVIVRIPEAVTPDALTVLLKEWCGEAVDPAIEWSCVAVRRPRSTRLASAFVRAIHHQGGAHRFKVKTGTSDMNLLAPAWGCPTVAYGPGDSHLDHTPNEHIDVRDLRRGVDVLSEVLANL